MRPLTLSLLSTLWLSSMGLALESPEPEVPSPANSSQHELVLSATKGLAAVSKIGSALVFAAGYNILVFQGVQLGTALELARIGIAGGDLLSVGLLVGPTVNIPFSPPESALFLSFKVGAFYTSPEVGAATLSALNASVGKRFPLGSGLYYRPALVVQKLQGRKVSYTVEFLVLSTFF